MKKLHTISAFLIVLISACSSLPGLSRKAPSSSQRSSEMKEKNDADLLRKIREKPSHSAPVTIRLDQNMLQPLNKPIYLATFAKSQPGLHTQMIGDHPLETGEVTFPSDGHLTYETTFQAQDINNRHILKLDWTGDFLEGDVVLNQISYHFARSPGDHTPIQLDSLLLKQSNSLRLDLISQSGKKINLQITVSDGAGKEFRLEPVPTVLPAPPLPSQFESAFI